MVPICTSQLNRESIIHSYTQHTNSNWSPLTLIGAHCHVFPIISTQEMQSGDMQVTTSYHSAMRNNDCLTVLCVYKQREVRSVQVIVSMSVGTGFAERFQLCVCVVITFITNTM